VGELQRRRISPPSWPAVSMRFPVPLASKIGSPPLSHPPHSLHVAPHRRHDKDGRATAGLDVPAAVVQRVLAPGHWHLRVLGCGPREQLRHGLF
jgi:hypothetical protein